VLFKFKLNHLLIFEGQKSNRAINLENKFVDIIYQGNATLSNTFSVIRIKKLKYTKKITYLINNMGIFF